MPRRSFHTLEPRAFELQVLFANALIVLRLPSKSSITNVFWALREHGHTSPEVVGSLAEYKPGEITFYRLDPPPHAGDFEYDDDDIVTNAAQVLSNCQKKRLRQNFSIKSAFPDEPDVELVCLFLETPAGAPPYSNMTGLVLNFDEILLRRLKTGWRVSISCLRTCFPFARAPSA